MNWKKLAIGGILALVVLGCVIAAGCTSAPAETTATTGTDAVVGVWTLPDETIVVFGEDFNGIMVAGDTDYNFTWKKTTDGKYLVDREDGAQVLWTLDTVKGTMSNPNGDILTKQASDTSGTSFKDINDKINAAKTNALNRLEDKKTNHFTKKSTQTD